MLSRPDAIPLKGCPLGQTTTAQLHRTALGLCLDGQEAPDRRQRLESREYLERLTTVEQNFGRVRPVTLHEESDRVTTTQAQRCQGRRSCLIDGPSVEHDLSAWRMSDELQDAFPGR